MKIVLDTNVLLSAIVFGGVAGKVYEFCLLHVRLFTSSFILQEVEEKLKGKLKIPDEYLTEALFLLKEKNEIIEPHTPKPTICRKIYVMIAKEKIASVTTEIGNLKEIIALIRDKQS